MDTATAREPRQERSRATRRRLLAAAVRCLAEVGWSGSTVAAVAERAGVSRGAAQHHFPTREALFTAAVRYVSEARSLELRRRAADLPQGPARTEAVVELLVDSYVGPEFAAALQLWAAAANDARLRADVLPLEEHVGRESHRLALDLLGVDESASGVREIVQATLDLARGLGLAGLLADDRARRRRIVQRWARALERELAAVR
ncbi:TetR/AcrR family transcriptional regulator [Marinactinospora thermotolerans]|uniref:Transcriptional regulator, TetR family n=1 Tax=Marinactinospora thermotolerans DSM 45154 TaxID=1122192 RepID=A0A1T4RLK6_9ACTN|nr:helix-turn-helix domain-containing protein [Marinactinospora thermotolerans]SKA16676.1 transcriptional regulator, TetR family [Marinactinospora thermotolerans DSM 45154]